MALQAEFLAPRSQTSSCFFFRVELAPPLDSARKMPVEVLVNTHRTSRVAGKDVTEYSVSARTVRTEQQDRQAADRQPGRCLSWHRYTDFRVLHGQCAAALGLGRWFPCPKALIFTDAQRQERADELHAYLQSCVAAAGDAPLPPALQADPNLALNLTPALSP